MTSEIRTNSLKSRAGLSTVTLTDSGPMFSGITTFVDNSGFNIGTGSSIFSPATNTLTFGTNSNERFRIASNGNIKIGSGAPAIAVGGGLEIDTGSAATIRLEDSGSTSSFEIQNSSSVITQNMYNNQPWTIAYAGSEKLRIDSSGRMGLGTDNPEEILHVKAASETVNSRDGVIFQSSSALAADTGLPLVFSTHIGNDPNYSVASIAGRKENASSGDGAGYLQFATGSSAGAITEKFRITSGGCLFGNNIGIGTDNRWKIRPNSNNTQLAFEYSTSTTLSDTNIKVLFNADGKVGINQTPDAAGGLVQIRYNEVYTSGTTNLLTAASKAALRIRTSSDSSKSLFFGGIDESATPYLQVGNMSSASGGATATYPLVFQPYGGNVGVNTTSPASALEVRGDISVTSSLAKISMTDADGGDYFQIRNDAGSFKIRNSTDGRDDISITNNTLTLGGVAKITDNNSIFFGDNNDIEMRHNATSSSNQIIGKNHNFLLQSYGTIYLQCFQSGNSTNGNVLTGNYNNGTALYYQNGERIVTTNAGSKITNNLTMGTWLNISQNGTYAPASVGRTANNHEGIFWHSGLNYSIFRKSGTWGSPNYQQLRIDWPTGIRIDGGAAYGLSGARFHCHTMPTTNNGFDLGTSALRWRDVYCNQGAFNNSDIELKQDIASLTAAEMKAAKRLSALFKTYRWKDAVEEKGTDKARTHTGMIAQQIQAAMSAEGLDATKYGLFGIDEWYENDKKEIITLDQLKDDIPDPLDSSKTVTPPSTEGYTKITRYSVRYTELLSFIAAYNDQRFADLESRVAHLQESITKIETLEQDNIALRTRVTNLEGD